MHANLKWSFLLTVIFNVHFFSSAQDVLPFPPAPSASVAGRTVDESIYRNRTVVSHLPKDAPNILIVLIDDVGPGLPDTYGGEIHTPNLTKMAGTGISYNRFHSTAMCSLTRSALLCGRNHTRIGNGQITELGGLDVLGSPKADNMYHAGWAWAGSTPFKGTKLLGAYFGGTRQPMAISWPGKIKPDKTPHTQFHHVTDIVPIIYEIVGIKPPMIVDGYNQDHFDGVSMAYSFNDATAAG